jgi:hypothetical protein
MVEDMEMKWQEELLRQAKEIMIKGGELHFKVIVRSKERLPEICSYPNNFLKCNTETLTE